MPRKTMIEAVREAMDVMMGRDDDVVVFGEDVGFARVAGEVREEPLL
jgi:2-oxoisovalerate dehydrogenase E1 component beta subunit